MKPFNLEQAKAGKPVCTRDGRSVVILKTDRKYGPKGDSLPIIALINVNNLQQELNCTGSDGRYYAHQNQEHGNDLFMADPQKKYIYILWRKSKGFSTWEFWTCTTTKVSENMRDSFKRPDSQWKVTEVEVPNDDES